MIDSLLKFVAPTGLGVVSFGSLIIYSHLSLPKPPTQTEGNNNTKQTLEQDAEQNEPEQSLIATTTENQETDVVTPINDEKIDTSNQSTDTEESEKPPVETTAIETLEEEILTTIKYDEKYKEIIENSDYFYNQEYRTQDLSENEKAEIDEIQKLYSEYKKIIEDLASELKISNKILVTNLGNNVVEFYDKNDSSPIKINNFDIIIETKQKKETEKYAYVFKLNYFDKWRTLRGTKEFVNEWGSKIAEANKKLFDKVLEYKLNNKTKLDKEIIDKYEQSKENYKTNSNIIMTDIRFIYRFWYIQTNAKGEYDEKSKQLFETTLKDYKNWHIDYEWDSETKIKYGYFLKYLYYSWLKENQDKKVLKDVDLNAEFAKIDQLTSNKLKDLNVISNQINITISEWVINYLSNSGNEKEWKTDKFKNVKNEYDIWSMLWKIEKPNNSDTESIKIQNL